MAEATFLEDQVRRLGELLDDGTAAAAATAPWLADREALPPLLFAYDEQIKELERSVALHRERAEAAERKALNTETSVGGLKLELRHALEASLHTGTQALAGLGGGNSAAAAQLQERLEVVYRENEILTEQQRETAEELERVREEKLQHARDHMAVVKQCVALRDEIGSREHLARRATESRDRARSELEKCAAELVQAQEQTQQAMSVAELHAAERDAALASVAEHRTMLGDLNARSLADRGALAADLAVARSNEEGARNHAGVADAQLLGAAGREKQLVDRLQAELADKASGAEALSVLEGRCANAEARLETAAAELASAHAALNEASAERVVLVATAQAAEAAAAKADGQMALIRREEAERREALAATLRKEAISRSTALEDEVRTMESTVADLQHQLARAQRDRGRLGGGGGSLGVAALELADGTDAASASLRVTYGGSAARGSQAMEEMASRLADVERERDSTEQQRRSLAMQLRTLQDSMATERAVASADAEQVRRQMRRLEDESAEMRQQRTQTLGQLAEGEQKLATTQSELSQLRHTSAEELRVLQEATAAQLSSVQRQLSDARSLQEQSAAEVEELLRNQEELSRQYRDEAKSVAQRSEALVLELRAESERLTIRNAELSSQLSHVIAQHTTLEQADKEKSTQLVLARKALQEAQLQCSQHTAQVAQLRAAKQAWQAERKVLQTQAQAERHAAYAASVAPPRRSTEGAHGAKGTAAVEVEEALAAARIAHLSVVRSKS